MSDALVWIVAAGALAVGEVLTLAAVAGLLAGGALAAFVVALLVGSFPLELGVFAVVSTLLLVLVRPLAVRQRERRGDGETSSIVGAQGTVVEAIGAGGGQVRLNGELWRARPEVDSDVIPAGATVSVHSVDGATVHVYPSYPVGPSEPG